MSEPRTTNLPRLAVICDLVEENWPSMDLVAEMLLAQLRRADPPVFDPVRLCPPFARRFSRLPVPRARQRTAMNADRLLNRLWDYPRGLRHDGDRFDYHHVCDHTYANVVHSLPRGRTGVFCHDLDTFRSLLQPAVEPRPRWFRAMARRVLSGMKANSSPLEGLLGQIHANKTHDLLDRLGEISVPTLITVGELDMCLPPAYSHELHNAIAGSDLVVFPGGSHLYGIQDPQTFNAATLGWLAEHDQRVAI